MPDDEEATPEQAEAIRGGLQAAVDKEKEDTGVVLRWAVVVEVADAETGKRRLWRYADPNMASWDAWGFLAFAALAWDTEGAHE